VLGERPALATRALAWLSALVLAACTSSAAAHRSPAAPSAAPPSAVTVPPSLPVVAVATTTTSTPSVTAAARDEALRKVVDGFTADQPVPFSVIAVDLDTGGAVRVEADRQVLSASLYKLFVARELLRRIAAGTLERTAPAGDNEGRTVDQCIHDMIVVSDNACGLAGLDMVGGGDMNASLAADGYVSTRLDDPQQTSADDVALFLERARDGTLLGPAGEAYAAELYRLLAAQQVDDRFPRGLPPGTPIAHKTGDRFSWAHDAGIITTPHGDLLLIALSGPWPYPCCDADNPGPLEHQAFDAMADLAAKTYAAMAA
jgi:beta-lactamase class A